MERARASCFFSPPGRRSRQRDEGGKGREIRQRCPLIRPFGPPSPRRGEETSRDADVATSIFTADGPSRRGDHNPFFTLHLNHPLTQVVKRMDEVWRLLCRHNKQAAEKAAYRVKYHEMHRCFAGSRRFCARTRSGAGALHQHRNAVPTGPMKALRDAGQSLPAASLRAPRSGTVI